jgi:uncharacterized membrane-anchored protein
MKNAMIRHVLLVVGLLVVAALSLSPALAGDDDLKKMSKPGPITGELAGVAQIKVPKGYLFVGKENMKRFDDLTKNLYSPSEVGVIITEDSESYMLFSYSSGGYIKDDQKDKLNASELLKALQASETEANKERKKQKLPIMEVPGWETPPRFDDKTKCLSWALRTKVDGHESIIYSSRILARDGYMSAILICDSKDFKKAVADYDKIMETFTYKEGRKYSDWKAGDKVATGGLRGLILGEK